MLVQLPTSDVGPLDECGNGCWLRSTDHAEVGCLGTLNPHKAPAPKPLLRRIERKTKLAAHHLIFSARGPYSADMEFKWQTG